MATESLLLHSLLGYVAGHVSISEASLSALKVFLKHQYLPYFYVDQAVHFRAINKDTKEVSLKHAKITDLVKHDQHGAIFELNVWEDNAWHEAANITLDQLQVIPNNPAGVPGCPGGNWA